MLSKLLANSRKFFYDDFVSLLLLYFFSPVFTSMRALQQASELEKVLRQREQGGGMRSEQPDARRGCLRFLGACTHGLGGPCYGRSVSIA